MATVNRNDETLQKLDNTKNTLINEAQANYNKVSSGAEDKYNELIEASKNYGEQQAEITQQQTNQTIAEINQNKDKVEKDYIKEQKAGYADYAKQTNAYGTNAEIQASAGLQGSGFSESSKISAYNTYQNRYATAREVYNQAVLNYNNQIAQAQIQNNAQLAEIAFNSLQTQLQLALEGFQYQNELLNNLFNQKLNVSTSYDNLWQSQYNTLLGEAQFNEQMAYQRERDAIADSQWQQQFNLSRAKASSSSGSARLTSGSSKKTGSSGLTDSSKKNSKVDEIEKTLKARYPEGLTDNMSGQMKFRAWEANSIKYIQEADLTSAEKADLISRLNLGL